MMLGVRRAGVTVTTHILEGNGLIRARRGMITILDRERLKELADDAYGVPEAEYERMMSEG
jgi:Crp-like helix-turn-helix domain